MAGKNNIIIIKKVDGDGHGGHHGGGWKVAYADFMTAMMAFFLLMWILASSDEKAKRGLADYFTPSLSQAGGRGQGLLDGEVLGKDGVLGGSTGNENIGALPNFGRENPLARFDSRLDESEPDVVVEYEVVPVDGATEVNKEKVADDTAPPKLDLAALAKAQELNRKKEKRKEQLESVREKIESSIKADTKIADLSKNLTFEIVPDGLLVQLVDHKGRAMFHTGSAKVQANTRKVIQAIAQSIADLPYPIEISGHTDASPFLRQTGYDNWDLSTDRANATRRIMIASGTNPRKIRRVSGFADKQLLNKESPKAAENRRIGILLLYPDPA
jgi:chemotaxis protein MotB